MAVDVTKMLGQALGTLEGERSRIDRQISAIRAALGSTDSAGAPRQRRRMSAADRAAVSKRMKAYWAKRRAAKGKKPQGKKRTAPRRQPRAKKPAVPAANAKT